MEQISYTTAKLTESSTKDPESWEGHETQLQIFRTLSALLLIHIPLIIVTNTVVIVTYIYYSKLHTPGNLILTWLSITDLINGLVNIPILVISNLNFTFFKRSETLCILRYLPLWVFADFSVFMLLLLAGDRYLALSRPFWYINKVTFCTVFYAMLFEVVLLVIYCTVYIYLFDYDMEIPDLNKRCTFKGTTPIWLNTHVSMVLVVVKLVISIYFTIYVACTLWNKIKDTKKTQGSFMSKQAVEKITANGKIAIILMFIYIIILVPQMAQIIQNIFDWHTEWIFFVVLDHFRFANCSANAFIYAFSRKIYRKAYWFILTNRPSKWAEISSILNKEDIVSSVPRSHRGCVSIAGSTNSTNQSMRAPRTDTPDESNTVVVDSVSAEQRSTPSQIPSLPEILRL